MKNVFCVAAAALLLAPMALAEVHIRPLKNTLGPLQQSGRVEGRGVLDREDQADQPSPLGSPFNLYDSTLATPPGTIIGVPYGLTYVDWTASAAGWGDDLHLSGTGPQILTAIKYNYLNSVASATHTVRIFNMVPPSASHGTVTATLTGQTLLGTVTVPGVPSGSAAVTVTGLSILLPNPAVWVSLEESGPGAPDTFWLTGGLPTTGSSHADTLAYYIAPTPHLSIPIPYLYFGGGSVTAADIWVALRGQAVVEACCLPDGSCAELLVDDCVDQGGTPQGPDTDCADPICPAQIPTVSEWGLIVLAGLLLIAGTIVIRREMAARRVAA